MSSAGHSGADLAAGSPDLDFAALTAKLPVSKDTASALVRRELFNRFDLNGNGVLSLAEVDKAMRDVMGIDSLFSAKPVLIRAFQAARDANKGKGGKRPHRDGLNSDGARGSVNACTAPITIATQPRPRPPPAALPSDARV